MKLKLIDAVSLHNIVSQVNVNCLSDDKEKLSLIRLTVKLKHYAQMWQDTVDTARTMAAEQANTLLEKETKSEVEIDDSLLISTDSIEKLVVANSKSLNAGALGYILDFIARKEE